VKNNVDVVFVQQYLKNYKVLGSSSCSIDDFKPSHYI